MALSDEQRAMLQLLLEGGQGYEDIGSLLGIPPDEVRSRARAALTEMGGGDPDAQVALTDYLLGQADPIGRADAVRHLQNDPEANALAERLLSQLRLLAPRAQLPEIPDARGGRRAAPPPPAAAPPEQAPPPSPAAAPPAPPKGPGFASRIIGFLSGLGGGGKRRTQLIVAGATALVLAVAVLIVLSSGGGDDGGGGDCNTIDISAAQQAGLPTVELKPAGAAADAECPASGQATLAPVQAQGGQNQGTGFALQVNAADLEPTGDGDVYVLWLYNSDDQALPLGQQTTNADGELTGGIPLAPQQVLLMAAFRSIRLARTSAADAQGLQQVLQQSLRKKSGRPVPFVGETALEGAISELGLEQLLQQAQGGGGGGGAGQGGGSGQ